MRILLKISLCIFSYAVFLNAAYAQNDSPSLLTVSTVRKGSSDVVKLRVFMPHTAIQIAQIKFAIPLVWFIDGNPSKGIVISVGTKGMKQKIREWIEEADVQILTARSPNSEQGKTDRFWRTISCWAAAYDTFGYHENGAFLEEGDPALMRQANQKTFSSLDSLLSEPAQRDRKPIILLWLGFLAKSFGHYSDAERYYQLVLDGYPAQPERCIVAEFWLADAFKKDGESQQADSIFIGIPKKYSKLTDYSALYFWCNQHSHKK